MKTKLTLVLLLCCIYSITFAQNKKEIAEQIKNLETKCATLENEMSSLKTNLTSLSTTVQLLSQSNTELKKKVDEQKKLIEKLVHQNDSLLKAGGISGGNINNPKTEEDSIYLMVQQFFSAKKLEDRIKYVLNPNTVKSKIEKYHDGTYKVVKMKIEDLSIQGSDFKIGDNFRVKYRSWFIYCKKTKDGFKIDWEATYGYCDTPLVTYQATLSKQPKVFRVKAKIDNYYNYNYRGKEGSHWNVRVESSYGEYADVSCYILKSSAYGKKIYEILKDGKTHDLILELKIDPSEDNSGGMGIITKFIQEGWSK